MIRSDHAALEIPIRTSWDDYCGSHVLTVTRKEIVDYISPARVIYEKTSGYWVILLKL